MISVNNTSWTDAAENCLASWGSPACAKNAGAPYVRSTTFGGIWLKGMLFCRKRNEVSLGALQDYIFVIIEIRKGLDMIYYKNYEGPRV